MFLFGLLITRRNFIGLTEDKIKDLTSAYVNTYNGQTKYESDKINGYRVTLIDSSGRVFYDSEIIDLESMDNHLDREEIKKALNGNPKVITRKSGTLNLSYLYYAEKVDCGETYVIIRLSMRETAMHSYLTNTIPVSILIMCVAVVCTSVCSILIADELLKPLSKIKVGLQSVGKGNFKRISTDAEDEDVNKILLGINDVAEKLEKSILDTKTEKEKLDYVINNVTDGIVVITPQKEIFLSNASGENIFNARDCVGKSVEYLIKDQKIISSIYDCIDRKSNCIFQKEISNEWYLCSIKRVESGMVIFVLTNVTASKNSERTRLEFFANASHELKTPLTTIKGFNELISMQTDNEKIVNYSSKIEKETTRMLSLIEDMLNLSKLENSKLQKEDATLIDLKEISKEVISNLSVLSAEKRVNIFVEGDLVLRGYHEHFYELIKNLVENGIKYNNSNGTVKISLAHNKIIVADNGIGIDANHQNRIFERFYRVDKSRSREKGGTGLGLSIVKHVVDLYNGKIILNSKPNEGTTIIIEFN